MMSIKFDDLLSTGFSTKAFILPEVNLAPQNIINSVDFDIPIYIAPTSLPTPPSAMSGVANVVVGALLNTDNVSDTASLNLDSAWGIFSLEFGGTTYVYVSGQLDNGLSIFEMDSSGDLTHLANVDDNVATALTGARQIQSLDIGGTTYMYVSAGPGAINVFSVDTLTGMPTFIEAVVDNGALNLVNTAGRMSFVEVGTKTFLVASAFNDDGLSVFEIGTDGRLITNTYNVSDAVNLNAAYDTATIEVGGNDFVFATAAAGDSLTTYQMDANGDLVFIDRLTEAVNPALELNGAVGLATATINSTAFVFVSAFDDDGISVFSVASTGALTNVFNFGDSVGLNGSHGLEIIEFAGETFLASVSRNSDAMSLFHVSASGALTRLDSAVTTQLDNAIYIEGILKDGNPFLIGTGLNGDGVSVFEVGGGNDVLAGTNGQDLVLGLRGDDTLDPNISGTQGDIYDGGEGIDTFTLAGNNANYTIDLSAGTFFLNSNPTGFSATLQDIENIIGGNGSDTLTGDNGDNRIESGTGSDTIDGGEGNDTTILRGQANDVTGGNGDDTFIVQNEGFTTTGHIMRGGAGFDTLDISALAPGAGISLFASSIERLIGASYGDTWFGTSGNDVIDGNDGNDTLSSGFGDDVINGGEGNDSINGGSGADMLSGGNGTDTLLYTGSSAGVTVDLTANTASGGYASGDVISGFENIEGSGFNDILTGTSGINIMTGGSGADILYGGLGDDTLNGGDGDDILDGGIMRGSSTPTGNDIINGGDGDDTIIYSYEFTSSTDIDAVDGGAGMDTYVISTLTVSGRTVDLTAGTLVWNGNLRGTLANIENVTVNGPVTVIGDGGDNVIIGTSATHGNYFSGLDGNDTINGGGGDDTLSGGDGNDVLNGGNGNDELNGGTGNDTIDVGDGVDIVNAGDGSDFIIGGAGADNIDGNGGVDTLSYSSSSAGVMADLILGTGLGGDAEGDALFRIENLQGSQFNDTLIGDASANVLEGSDGNDTLIGDDGNDTLIGGLGDDTLSSGNADDVLIGGVGADTLDGGAGIDTADYSGSSDRVLVNLNANATNYGDALGDSLSNIENVIGSDFDDILTGTAAGQNTLLGGLGSDTLRGLGGEDVLGGGEGNDTLEGGGADDVLIGGAGADVIDGATGRDTASYEGSDSRVVISLINDTVAGGHGQGDTISNIESLIGSDFDDIFTGSNIRNFLYGGDGADTLNGRGGQDFLFGDEGNDTLIGGGGYDRLNGGAGNDTLTAGSTRDIFLFDDNFGKDIITDFNNSLDVIDFTNNSTFNNFTDVTAVAVQLGADVIIQDGADMITLQNFNLANLDATDFVF